jgi:hypothetical protein
VLWTGVEVCFGGVPLPNIIYKATITPIPIIHFNIDPPSDALLSFLKVAVVLLFLSQAKILLQ